MKRVLIIFTLLAGCGESANTPRAFIALQSDFASFQSWERVFVGDQPLEGHPLGARYAYVSERPAAGQKKYPVGAMIVKTVEVGPTPQEWDLFGMVKRGAGYNNAGARDWEFFLLRIAADGTPVIAARGVNPSDDADGGVGSYPAGGANGMTTCNRCHGVAGSEATDHILAPTLYP